MPRQGVIGVDGAQIHYTIWGDGPPTIVLLHDGLGSIAQFGAFPGDLARRSQRSVVAYDRPGHGRSEPVPDGPWPTDWLHLEARRLGTFCRAMGIERPHLVGHSDGGSIVLIRAIDEPNSVASICTLAAHCFVEPVCFQRIADMRKSPGRWVKGLERFHRNGEAVFQAWSGVWTSEAFQTWDIREALSAITCPAQIMQGRRDEYATDVMLDDTVEAIGSNAVGVLITGAGHLLPQHHGDAVLDQLHLIAELPQ